jgi:tetratricopeptide (TPR) repeat protein
VIRTPFRTKVLVAAALLLLGGWITYGNSFAGPFVYDDGPSITSNSTIQHLWPLGKALSPPADGRTVSGRPILNLSFALNYAWSRRSVRSYHVVNLTIHLLAGLTLFGIARRTLIRMHLGHAPPSGATTSPRSDLTACAIALLWTVHPLQTEAVTYVVQRAESLMGLFYLLTLYLFIRGVDSPASGATSRVWLGCAWTCCLLGMATKEVMVSAPLLVLLYDRAFLAGTIREALRRRWRIYVALTATWLLLGYLVISGGGDRNGSMGIGAGISFPEYLPTQFEAIAHYLRLAIWPSSLIFEYGPLKTSYVAALPFATVVTLLATLAVCAFWRWPKWGFLGAWFFAILAPTSLVPGATQMIVEHRMYLPLAAVLAAVACGLDALVARTRAPRSVDTVLRISIFGIAAVGCIVVSRRRNNDYASGLTLWRDTVTKRPNNAFAWNNFALELTTIPERLPEAIAGFQEALHINPRYPEAHYNLALVLARTPGHLAEAIEHYEKAAQEKPFDADVRNNLGNALARIPSRLPEAIAEYRTALEIRPNYAEAHNNLANALVRSSGGLGEALAHYQLALQLQPDYAQAHYNLANTLADIPGRLPEAAAHYEAAIRFNPAYALAHNNLAAVDVKLGLFDEAIRHFEAALRLNPALDEARENLATLRSARR